jgi:hypothetical protein
MVSARCQQAWPRSSSPPGVLIQYVVVPPITDDVLNISRIGDPRHSSVPPVPRFQITQISLTLPKSLLQLMSDLMLDCKDISKASQKSVSRFHRSRPQTESSVLSQSAQCVEKVSAAIATLVFPSEQTDEVASNWNAEVLPPPFSLVASIDPSPHLRQALSMSAFPLAQREQ